MSDKLAKVIGASWAKQKAIQNLFDKPIMKKRSAALKERRAKKTVYPESKDVFRAFRETPLTNETGVNVNVLILGDHPYSSDSYADGLCFSVSDPEHGLTLPQTIQTILKEVESDIGMSKDIVRSPDLTRWAHQGVLMLNLALTTEKGNPYAHMKLWQGFTEPIVQMIMNTFHPTVCVAWGRHAQTVIERNLDPMFHGYIDTDAPDDSLYIKNESYYIGGDPRTTRKYRGFVGSKPFSRINKQLASRSLPEIIW